MSSLTPAPGGRIDEKLVLTPVRVAVLTVSDTRDEESDTSGHLLAERRLLRWHPSGESST